MPNDFSIVMFDVNESVLYIHCIKVTYSVNVTFNTEMGWTYMGQLEIKHGLLQLTKSLGFLHNNA